MAQNPSKTFVLKGFSLNLVICEKFEFPEPLQIVNTHTESIYLCMKQEEEMLLWYIYLI